MRSYSRGAVPRALHMWNTDLTHIQRKAQRTLLRQDDGISLQVAVCTRSGYWCACICYSWCNMFFLLHNRYERHHLHPDYINNLSIIHVDFQKLCSQGGYGICDSMPFWRLTGPHVSPLDHRLYCLLALQHRIWYLGWCNLASEQAEIPLELARCRWLM